MNSNWQVGYQMNAEQGKGEMKILFYNHTDIVSGAERVLLLILSQLNSEFQSIMMCPAGDLKRQVEAQKIPCLEVKKLEARFTWRLDLMLQYLISFWHVMRSVRSQIKTINPDLIHANSIRAGLVITAATVGLKVPVIWHLHDLLPHHPISTAIRWFVLLASSRIKLLAVSQATADRFRGILLHPFKDRVSVKTILNCADTEKFQPDEKKRFAIRSELAINRDVPVIGIIGQITERKGQLGLLHAFKRVVQEFPEAVLLIVGEPQFNASDEKYFHLLRQTSEKLGITAAVRFLGARRDVPAVMQALDLLVVNSLAEPCGLVVLEGMASELPVIATTVGGNPEMIHHALNGWLVPVNDEQALAAAIIKLSRDKSLRKRLGAAARQQVQRQFSVAQYQQEIMQFYQQINSSGVENSKLTAVTDHYRETNF
jgi:L-malate glycosyltransferase